MEKKIIAALQECPLFEGLTAGEIEGALTAVGYSLVRLDKNDIYAFTGSRCLYADIVVEGEMTARMVGPSGKFVQMADLHPSALLAPAFIFSKDNRMPVSIETNKATTILRMRPTQLKEMMVNDDRILMNFVGQLSDTSSFLTKKVRMLTLLSVREKVAAFLFKESKEHQSNTFTLTQSRQEIADSFAIQKFSLQRCLNEFADEGIIRLEGKTITILDMKKIARHAGC